MSPEEEERSLSGPHSFAHDGQIFLKIFSVKTNNLCFFCFVFVLRGAILPT